MYDELWKEQILAEITDPDSAVRFICLCEDAEEMYREMVRDGVEVEFKPPPK
jgi:hypothetical protein